MSSDSPAKMLTDLLGDHQSKAHALLIDVDSILELPKQLEEVLHVILLNTNPCVLDAYLQILLLSLHYSIINEIFLALKPGICICDQVFFMNLLFDRTIIYSKIILNKFCSNRD